MSLEPIRSESQMEPSPGPAAVLGADDASQATIRERDVMQELSDAEFTELLGLQPQSVANASKQERDFVLAAFLLRGKHLTERQLRTELKSWTPFGALTLRQFLAGRGLLSEETLTKVCEEVEKSLRAIETRCSWRSSATAAGRLSSLLERIDPAGRLAKVLGLSKVPKAVVGTGTRTFRTKYQLLRKIGQGGLGTVWLAVDTSLNRYVAIKEVSGDCASLAISIARFRREAEITGRLDHPSIVPIHLLGEDEADGTVFYVMRFLGNATLDDAIREYHEQRELGRATPLAFHRLMTAFVSVCQAIAYAHKNKVIHRDLKPQNVALDGFGQVIVLDWGLAKTLGLKDPDSNPIGPRTTTDRLDDLDITFVGQVVGTPVFMAPEQAAGRVDDIDERTDVYGLGAILFSILTGYAPHESTHESMAAGSQVSQLFDLIVDKPVTSPRQINPTVNVALEAICLKAISKDRRLRYATAAELSEDVQRWMADEPVSAYQDGFEKRVLRWTRAHSRLTKVLAAVASVVLFLGLAAGLDVYRGAISSEQVRLKAATDEARKVRGRLAFEMEMLSKNARFMASVPPVEGYLEARQNSDLDEANEWTDRLKRIYRGLLEVNPHYSAVSFWTSNRADGQPVVVCSAESPLHDRQATEASVRRHSGSVCSDLKGRVFLAVPRFVPSAGSPGIPVDLRAEDPRLSDVFAGVCVPSEAASGELSGVAIECDLERMLQLCTSSATVPGMTVTLVDENGSALVSFTRERGLQKSVTSLPPEPVVAAYLAGLSPSEITTVSRSLCAARIPLDSRDRFLGLIVTFPERPSPGR